MDHLYIEVVNTGPPTIPADPTSLSMDSEGFTNLDISWADNSNNEDNFRVERFSHWHWRMVRNCEPACQHDQLFGYRPV